MTHTTKQFVSAATFCLAALLSFSSCEKQMDVQSTQPTSNGYQITEKVKNNFLVGSPDFQARQNGPSPTIGGTCKVTSGPNKGKTGKYTQDSDGSIWCSGSWGGTECGTGKCSSSTATPPSGPGTAQLPAKTRNP